MPAIAPTGGTEGLLGTNPIGAAFPVPNADPVIADMPLKSSRCRSGFLAPKYIDSAATARLTPTSPLASAIFMHWDVWGDTETFLAAGARLLRGRDDEIGWDVLADPEGNEFCVFTRHDI